MSKNKLGFTREKINYYAIMLEGIFNLMGYDLLGITTIVPLFLLEYGASLGLIGMITTMQGAAGALIPLLFGGFAARAKSKRKLSLIINGIARGSMIVIPISLILNLPGNVIVGIFLFALSMMFLGGPLTGLSWNYLLNDCVEQDMRPKLLGVLFATSGVISFASSNFIKIVRDSQTLASNMKYFYIFGVAAIAMCVSVLCFIPLKENPYPEKKHDAFSAREYILSLLKCFKNKDFFRLTRTNIFSYISMVLNAFLFVYAERSLNLASNLISNMIIFQTLGIIAGGILTGQVSSRFGVKRMLLLVESMALLIPILGLLTFAVKNPYPLMCICVSILGFSRSGMLGYNNYIIEVVEKDELIFSMVAKGLIMLPLSFLSTLAGVYIQSHTMVLIFSVQIAASLAAIFMCSRLRLVERKKVKTL